MQSKLSTSTIAQEETGLVQESSFPKKTSFFTTTQNKSEGKCNTTENNSREKTVLQKMT